MSTSASSRRAHITFCLFLSLISLGRTTRCLQASDRSWVEISQENFRETSQSTVFAPRDCYIMSCPVCHRVSIEHLQSSTPPKQLRFPFFSHLLFFFFLRPRLRHSPLRFFSWAHNSTIKPTKEGNSQPLLAIIIRASTPAEGRWDYNIFRKTYSFPVVARGASHSFIGFFRPW